jgi:hemoglobin
MSSTEEQQSHYEQMGGEAGVRRLVDRFYDLMDSAPEAKHVRALHATSLKQSREKLFMFLSGWSGGPQLYTAAHGHPRLRMRHFPFAIASRERDEWLWCMDRALAEHTPMPDELRTFLSARFHDLADHMRNRPDPGVAGLPVAMD